MLLFWARSMGDVLLQMPAMMPLIAPYKLEAKHATMRDQMKMLYLQEHNFHIKDQNKASVEAKGQRRSSQLMLPPPPAPNKRPGIRVRGVSENVFRSSAAGT